MGCYKLTYIENQSPLFVSGSSFRAHEKECGRTYDLPYRNYDAALGRFHQIDPLAQTSHSMTPYHYAGNNPIGANDPSGLLSVDSPSWLKDLFSNPYADWPGYDSNWGSGGGGGGGGGRGSGDGSRSGGATPIRDASGAIIGYNFTGNAAQNLFAAIQKDQSIINSIIYGLDRDDGSTELLGEWLVSPKEVQYMYSTASEDRYRVTSFYWTKISNTGSGIYETYNSGGNDRDWSAFWNAYSPYQMTWDDALLMMGLTGADTFSDAASVVTDIHRGHYGSAALSAAATLIPFVNVSVVKNVLKYQDRVEKATDLYHDFPRAFDSDIIQNGAWSQRIKDGADWFELPGSINGVDGVYQLGINNSNEVFHRNFVPRK
jgi:RHS repeat-associated protein